LVGFGGEGINEEVLKGRQVEASPLEEQVEAPLEEQAKTPLEEQVKAPFELELLGYPGPTG
jgi:hypothetical protein